MVNVVPYGMGGNFAAPAGIPIFGPCDRVYSADEERAADVRRAQEYARERELAAERAREAAAKEARHREQVNDNRERYGPADSVRDRIGAMDARLKRYGTYPDGAQVAAASLVLALAGTYLVAVRHPPSPVGEPPDWLPAFLLTMPGWALLLATATTAAIAAGWALIYLRNAPYPHWKVTAIWGLLLGGFGAYLVALRWRPSPVGQPPDWLPSFLLTMPGWILKLLTASSLSMALAWPVCYTRYVACRRSNVKHRAARDELLGRLGCGDVDCGPCMAGLKRSAKA